MQFVKIKIKIIEQPRELIIEKTGFNLNKKKINKYKNMLGELGEFLLLWLLLLFFKIQELKCHR